MTEIFRQCERAVLHFNVADFAVVTERVVDSSLRQRPLIIAPPGAARAVVYDMSEEAYRDGVRKGMMLRHATRLCRGATVLPPRTDLYRRAMAALFKELCRYSPLIESGTVDGHFFIDVTGTHRLHGPAPDVGWRVRREVGKRLGLHPIWALGANKLVAKVASRLVKPVGEYIVTPGEEEAFLAPLPVELLPGLSALEMARMREFRIHSIGGLADLSRQQLVVVFGGRGEFLHRISRGIDDSRVALPATENDRIELVHSFADDTNSRSEVEAAVVSLAGKAGRKLRQHRQVTRRLGVWLRYSDGAEVVRQASCRNGSAEDFMLHRLAHSALQRAWLRRTRIRSCRLVCDRLRRSSPQLALFPQEDLRCTRRRKLLGAMDTLRERFGDRIVGVGREFPNAVASGIAH